MTKIAIYEFNGKQIEFDLASQNIMINATEMAKVFDARIDVFLKTQGVKDFIEAYDLTLKGGSSLVTKNGECTWMARPLALKFAAWLDPHFEVWIYTTIDFLLFGHIRDHASLQVSIAQRKKVLHKRLSADPDYTELLELETDERKLTKKISKQFKAQLNLFQ